MGEPSRYTSLLSQEITLQRLPGGCVYGWIEHNNNTLTFVENPHYARDKIEQNILIEDDQRYRTFISKVKQLAENGGKMLVNFPKEEGDGEEDDDTAVPVDSSKASVQATEKSIDINDWTGVTEYWV